MPFRWRLLRWLWERHVRHTLHDMSCAPLLNKPPPSTFCLCFLSCGTSADTLSRTVGRWQVTPLTLLRLLGPLGPYALRKVLLWRISRVHESSASRVALHEPETTVLAEYM